MYEYILNKLSMEYRPAPEIFGKNELLDAHANLSRQDLIPLLEVDLRGKSDKHEVLNDFIMQRANEAKKHFDSFQKLMKETCEANGGYRFKAGLKIKEPT